MTQPRMVIIAGPPGAGKSSIFSLSDFADNVFNADDRAAELNAGAYQSIPLSVRAVVNREFERFVYSNISAGTSFALETTLRSTISFDQAKLANEKDSRCSCATSRWTPSSATSNESNAAPREGGHSASETTLRRIHASSLANLPIALNPEESDV